FSKRSINFCFKRRRSTKNLCYWPPRARASRSRCQLHRKRESQHHVNGCRKSSLTITFGWILAVDSKGRTIWIADAHRDGKLFAVRADDKLTAFLELELANRLRGDMNGACSQSNDHVTFPVRRTIEIGTILNKMILERDDNMKLR